MDINVTIINLVTVKCNINVVFYHANELLQNAALMVP